MADADIRIWKPGAINGRVFDKAGEPLVDVVVSAVRRSPDGRLLDGPTARTDDRGIYRLGTLAPGQYVFVVPQMQALMPVSTIEALLARPPSDDARRLSSAGAPAVPEAGRRIAGSVLAVQSRQYHANAVTVPDPSSTRHVYPTTFHPAALGSSRATPIVVSSGEDRVDVDIHVQPVRALPVAGILLDSSGPVPDFGVLLLPAASADGASLIEVAVTATDARGAFVFPLVPPGDCTLLEIRTAAAPGRASARQEANVEARRPADVAGAMGTLTLTVASEPVSELVLAPRPPVRVSGHAEFQGSADLPTPELRQTPIQLCRRPPMSRHRDGSMATRITAAGEFGYPGVAAGRYELQAFDVPEPDRAAMERGPCGLATLARCLRPSTRMVAAVISVGGRDAPDGMLAIDDRDLTDLLLVYTDQPAGIAGVVRPAGGSVPADASVFIFPVDRARWPDARAGMRTFRTARISADGSFNGPNLMPGEYSVVAAPDGAAGDWPDGRLLARLAEDATTSGSCRTRR